MEIKKIKKIISDNHIDDLSKLKKGGEVIVITSKIASKGIVMTSGYSAVIQTELMQCTFHNNTYHINSDAILTLTEDSQLLLEEANQSFQAYAIIERLGHSNNSDHFDRQILLSNIFKRMPKDVLHDLNEMALNNCGDKTCCLSSLIDPATPEEYAARFLSGAVRDI
jgi:molecular chaperone DnaK (HSP70)